MPAARLALVRIYICAAGLILGATGALGWGGPFIAVAFAFGLIGLLGRIATLAAAVALGFSIFRTDELPTYTSDFVLFVRQGAWLLFSGFLAITRAWDAYSLDSLITLYYAGVPDGAMQDDRRQRGHYSGAVLALAAMTVIFSLVFSSRLNEAMLADTAAFVNFLLFLLLLAVALLPLEKALPKLALPLRRLYRPSDRYVIYDGDCGFCTRTAMVLERLDALRLLTFLNFRRELDQLHPVYRRDLNYEQCEAEVYYSDWKSNTGGFHAFRRIIWDLPLLWLTIPIFYFPGIDKVGDKVYKWIASNRFRIRLKNMDRCHMG